MQHNFSGYNSNRVYSPNRNTRTFSPYNDQHSNASTDTETYSDIDIDDINPYIAHSYNQSHVEYDVRKNNERNEEIPYWLNLNVEATRPARLSWRFNSNVQPARHASLSSRFNSNVDTARNAAQPSRFISNVKTARHAAQLSRI